MVRMESSSESPSAAITCESGTVSSSAGPQTALRTPNRPPVQTADRHITWDEGNLAEHDKERGTRQKIDEPPTPWASSPVVSEDEAGSRSTSAPRQPREGQGVDPLEVAARLAALEATEVSSPNTAKRTVSKEEAAEEAALVGAVQVQIIDMADATPRPSSASFRAKRARHYDEFRALQAQRAQQATSDDSN
mmetsp:Transcript_24386/g.56206  ORF Transcript_24386/g.56206 Transcript_24386/m.56206 type:complete len:192 (-) Transcript_24386:48-623(-)